jgi:hypothetical protein
MARDDHIRTRRGLIPPVLAALLARRSAQRFAGPFFMKLAAGAIGPERHSTD